jgi:hypothetical protein
MRGISDEIEGSSPSIGDDPGSSAAKSKPLRRTENRLGCIPTKGLVYVKKGVDPRPAEVRQVSKSGLQLVLDQPIPVGSTVAVEFSGMVVEGEIRYWRPNGGDSFDAGVEIESVQQPAT